MFQALDEDTLAEYQTLIDLPKNNYAKLRERIRLANPPCVPYLGKCVVVHAAVSVWVCA